MTESLFYITNARLSFPHIAEPQTQVDKLTGNSRTTYNCDLIVENTSKSMQDFMRVYGALAAEKWKESSQAAMQQIHANRKQRCYGAGEEKVDSKTFKPRTGYTGHSYITISNKNMPQIIGPDGKVVSSLMEAQALARKMYGGCYVNVAIKPWIQHNATGIGVRCDFVAIQFAADGEPFGEGAVDASGMFAPAQAATVGLPTPAGMPAFMAAPTGLPSFLG